MSSDSSKPGDHKPARVLVLLVDSDPVSLERCVAILGSTCEVRTARDGESALSSMRSEPVDVVCTASQLPKMSGVELLGQLANQGLFVAGVLLTDSEEVGGQATARKPAEAYHLVFKPFEPQQLLDAVQRAAIRTRNRRKVTAATTEARRTASQLMSAQRPPFAVPSAHAAVPPVPPVPRTPKR